MVYAILIAYLAITFISSLLGKEKTGDTPESYFLANRSLKPLVLFFTLAATTFSAFFFLGFAGDGYRTGFSFYAFMSFGTAMAATTFYLIGNKAWKLGKKHGYITPVEMIYDLSGSKFLRMCYLVVLMVFTFPYVALQPIGAGYIMEQLTGGQVPFIWGAAGLTIFISIYVLIGGMQSVVQTDVKQGILMMIMMVAALIWISTSMGGLPNALEQVRSIEPELFTHAGKDGHFTMRKWFSMNLLWLVCLPMLPHIFMRFFIAKELSAFKRSTLLYALIPALLFIFPVTIGILGHVDFPDLIGKDADKIFPMLLELHTPRWFTALILTGAIAAFMSTLDSQLLALGTIFTRDIFLKHIKPKASLKEQVRIGKISIVVFAFVGLLLAANPVDSLFVLGKLTFFGISVLFPPTIAILYFPKTNATAAGTAIILGEILVVLDYLQVLPPGWNLGFASFLPIIMMEFLIIWGCSILSPTTSVLSEK